MFEVQSENTVIDMFASRDCRGATPAMVYASRNAFERALATLAGPDRDALAEARARQGQLAKPLGSLGRLEELAIFIAGWQGRELPFIARGLALVFAGNHGVALPAALTARAVAKFRNGGGAINALAQVAEIDLDVRPLDLDRPTADFSCASAMSEAECLAALSAGAAAIKPSTDLLVLGDIGIGNATAAAALCARSFGGSGADWLADPDGAATVDRALEFHANAPRTAFETLRRLGGREIAAIAGAILRARELRIPVVLDGFVCAAALAVLASHRPDITAHCIAGHCSTEIGHARALDQLGLAPLLRLDLGLGEGSGAALAVGIIRSALAAHADMATLAEAGVPAAA